MDTPHNANKNLENTGIISKEITLDVGCGNKKRGDVGIDIYPFEWVTVVADISKGLPFKDNVFATVFFTM